MDYLWTPWRYKYIADAKKDEGCIFCDALAAKDDVKTLIVFRGRKNFIILNRFPYTAGHVMVVPYAHSADLSACDAETLAELMSLAQRSQAAPCASVYRPGQPLVMRASALTQVISAITSAAPPVARAPRCTRW